MSKIFYDHLINIEEIVLELDGYELTFEEKDEFINLIDGTLHHHTLQVILDLLPQEHHQDFLDQFYQAPHDQNLITYLKEKITDEIEKRIEEKAVEIKKEILLEIKKTSKVKKK